MNLIVSFTLCVCVYDRIFQLDEMPVNYVLLWTWWGACSAWFPGYTRAIIHNPSLHPIEIPTPRCCPLHPVSNKRNIKELMACSHCPRPRPRPKLILILMELGLIIMLGSGYSGPRPRPMQISIGSVHILSVSVLVLGSVNEPQGVHKNLFTVTPGKNRFSLSYYSFEQSPLFCDLTNEVLYMRR